MSDRDNAKALFIELTNSQEITDALFDSYLDMSQAYVEQQRPFMYIRGEDSSQTISGSLTLTTRLNLATDFLRWYDAKRSIQLIATLGPNSFDNLTLLEIPIAARFQQQFSSNKSFMDYANKQFGITGTLTKTYTVYQFYIKQMPLVSATDGNGKYTTTWWPPNYFKSVLALLAAAFWQLGADYDVLSNPKGNQHAKMAASILNAMAVWDDDLAHNAQVGLNTFGDTGYRDHNLGPGWATSGQADGDGY